MIVSTAERFKEILRIFVLYFYDWIKQIYQDRYFCLISIRDGKWNSYRVPMPNHPNMTFIDEKQVHEKSKVIKTIFDWYSIFTNWFCVEFFHFCESFCGVYSLVSCSILLLWFYSFNTNIFIIYCIFINIQLMMNDVWVRMILFFKFIFFVRLFSLALDWTVHLKNKNLLIAFNHDEEKLVIFTEKYSFVGFPWMPTSFCRRLCFHSYILLYLLHFIELYTFSSSDSETRIDDDGGYA